MNVSGEVVPPLSSAQETSLQARVVCFDDASVVCNMSVLPLRQVWRKREFPEIHLLLVQRGAHWRWKDGGVEREDGESGRERNNLTAPVD